MFYSCKIKFAGITNLTDARFAAAAYADWISFCLIPDHPRYIAPTKVKEIIDWVAGPIMVAEVAQLLPANLAPALELLNIQTIETNHSESALAWHNEGYQVLWSGHIPLPPFLHICQPNQSHSPAHEIIDLTYANPEQINHFIANPPFAIQLSGGDETAAGMRDFDELNDILERFEQA